MTSRSAAKRYARALFDVALREKASLETIEQQLDAFAALLAQQPALEKILLNPAVPAPRKRAAVQAIVARTNTLPVAGKLLVLLAERDRLAILPDLRAAYRDRLLDHLKVVRAEVTTAAPLAPGRAPAIERSLARVTGGTVTLATRVDPGLIGGVVARVGSVVYDASVATQLQKMRQQLVKQTGG